jgi:hypothetical protein
MAPTNALTVEEIIKSFPNPVLPKIDNEPTIQDIQVTTRLLNENVKLLPLPHPPVRARTDARTNPSTQRATQLRSVLARVYAVSIHNQITTTVP